MADPTDDQAAPDFPANLPKPGEFPFPITDSDQESQYVTWVRNHSSYLAVGGFLNWAGAVAAYVRGVLGNLLVLMPILIVVGSVLGWFHARLLDTPLQLSMFAFLAGIVVLLLYFGRDVGLRYASESAPDSLSPFLLIRAPQRFWRWLVSWNYHLNPFWLVDRLWRNLTAWVLIAIGVCLLIDLSPQVIEFARKRALIENFGLKECAAAVLAAISSVGGLLQLLPKSKSIMQKFVVIAAAILSFAIVWGITLRIANYFYYGLPPHGFMVLLPFVCAGLLVLSELLRIWNSKDIGWLRRGAGLVRLVLLGGVGFALATLIASAFNFQTGHSEDALGTISRPLARLVNGLDADIIEQFNGSDLGDSLTQLKEKKANLDGEGPPLIARSASPIRLPVMTARSPESGNSPELSVDLAELIQERFAGSSDLYVTGKSIDSMIGGNVMAPMSANEISRLMNSDEYLRKKFLEFTGRDLVGLRHAKLWDQEEVEAFEKDTHKFYRSLALEQALRDPDVEQSDQPTGLVKIERHPAQKGDKETSKPLEFLSLTSFGERFNRLFTYKTFPAGYYKRTGVFVEQAESLGGLDEREKNKLLKVLGTKGVSKLISKVANQETVNDDFEAAVINRFLASKLSAGIDTGQANQILAVKESELAGQLKVSSGLLDVAKKWIVESTLPHSLGIEYLRMVPGRDTEIENYESSSAPDAALSGPRLIGDTWLEEEVKLGNAIEIAYLRVLLSKVNRKVADAALEKLDDSWFSDHSVTRSYFSKFVGSKREASQDEFSGLVNLVLQNENGIDKDGLRKRMGIVVNPAMPSLTPEEADDQQNNKAKKTAARWWLLELSLSNPSKQEADVQPSFFASRWNTNEKKSRHIMAELYDPRVPPAYTLSTVAKEAERLANEIYLRKPGKGFSDQELLELAAARFIFTAENNGTHACSLVRRMVHGRFGNLQDIESVSEELFNITWVGKLQVLLTILASLTLFCFLFINPNSTSLHGFYKKKLADAFIVKTDGKRVSPAGGVRLSELCNYKSGSTSPYHLINVAINMQGSDNPNIRDRNADFFVFSKNFVGGESTGYLETKEFESAATDVTAATAMAISAGAASPNMGKYTIGILSFLLTMVNLRLGYWIPNPRNLARKSRTKDKRQTAEFTEVFEGELRDIAVRRNKAGVSRTGLQIGNDTAISTSNQLLGLALSGGGIRSAAVNMGNVQVLEKIGLFKEIDYISTVSGGGYLGTSLSTFMRNEPLEGEQGATEDTKKPNIVRSKKWRPRASLLLREMVSMLHSDSKWINVSDGGHVENLGAFELLRRRCEIVIVGEGESDATGGFPGLSTLMRLAEIDLGVKIEFPEGSLEKLILPTNFDQLKGNELKEQIAAQRHFAVARIRYPRKGNQPEEFGFFLYVRSSLRGNEDQILKSYQKGNLTFPHESTADQMFNEGQFEAYRRLGVKMMTEALTEVSAAPLTDATTLYSNLRASLEAWWDTERQTG